MGEENQDLLAVENLRHQYPGGETLQFPDLRIRKGQHTLLLGDSGTGKTTFMHILTGLMKPSMGNVSIDGQDLYALGARALDHFRGQRIGIVFQNAHLINSLDLYANLQIAQAFAGSKHDPEHIKEVLATLDLSAQIHKFPQQLSRGQVQRAAIARAVINNPAILVADEPTASLDDTNTGRVMDLLFAQADIYGATLVLATHDNRIKERFNYTYPLARQTHAV